VAAAVVVAAEAVADTAGRAECRRSRPRHSQAWARLWQILRARRGPRERRRRRPRPGGAHGGSSARRIACELGSTLRAPGGILSPPRAYRLLVHVRPQGDHSQPCHQFLLTPGTKGQPLYQR
jgi:hypothetical protein